MHVEQRDWFGERDAASVMWWRDASATRFAEAVGPDLAELPLGQGPQARGRRIGHASGASPQRSPWARR